MRLNKKEEYSRDRIDSLFITIEEKLYTLLASMADLRIEASINNLPDLEATVSKEIRTIRKIYETYKGSSN